MVNHNRFPEVLALFLVILVTCNGETKRHDVAKSRQKRIVSTLNADMGILFAIALPLGIPDRNIFVSYNFEANYNNPTDANTFTEGFANVIKGYVEPLTAPSSPVAPLGIRRRSVSKSQRTAYRPQITRKNIYKMLLKHLQSQHFNGKACLQRIICEAALHPFDEPNGLVGDFIQIILSPSNSREENIPKEYLIAEVMGSNGSCTQYHSGCPKDPLSYVSFLK